MSDKGMPIPVEAAERIASAYGYDQIVIVARAVDGGEHVTTFGVGPHREAAARIGAFFKHRLMGWPVPQGCPKGAACSVMTGYCSACCT